MTERITRQGRGAQLPLRIGFHPPQLLTPAATGAGYPSGVGYTMA
jgi:hypothetical protein